MTETTTKIVIAEFIPAFNKGELAILNGILRSFEVLGNIEVATFSFYPGTDRIRYPKSVELIDIGDSLYLRNLPYSRSEIYNQWAIVFAFFQHILFAFLHRILGRKLLEIMNKPLWRTYSECDLIVICTDEVDCVLGSSLKFSPLYISALAKALKKPIVFYANGTTRFTSEVWIWRLRSRKLWRFLARHVLSAVDLVTVREEGTFLYFREITDGKVPIYLTADPAFLLSPASQDRVRKIMLDERIEKNGRTLVGVAMTYDVLSSAFEKMPNRETSYQMATREIAKFLDSLIEKSGSIIVFVPHAIEPNGHHDDRLVAKDIFSLMSNKFMVRMIVKEYSAGELKALFGQFDLLVSCRVHAAISALSMSTPVCMIRRSWDDRPYNIIGKMAKQERWIYDVENLNARNLLQLVSSLLDTSKAVRESLPGSIEPIMEKALLNGRLLRALLSSRDRN